jgi:hypothetical protein
MEHARIRCKSSWAAVGEPAQRWYDSAQSNLPTTVPMPRSMRGSGSDPVSGRREATAPLVAARDRHENDSLMTLVSSGSAAGGGR